MLSAWGRQRSDFLEHPCPIVSDAMRGVLDRCGVDNIQYWKAQLEMDLTGEHFYGFWLANVIGTLACVDRRKSNFEPSGHGESGVLLGFQVDPARTYGCSLFRLAEDSELIVASARVQAAVQAAKLSGILIQEPETYAGRPAASESDGANSSQL